MSNCPYKNKCGWGKDGCAETPPDCFFLDYKKKKVKSMYSAAGLEKCSKCKCSDACYIGITFCF